MREARKGLYRLFAAIGAYRHHVKLGTNIYAGSMWVHYR